MSLKRILIYSALISGLAVDAAQAQELLRQPIVYSVPGMDDVQVRRDIVFRTSGDSVEYKLDLYRPSGRTQEAAAVVVFVNAGGLDVRSWRQYTSWGRLSAASGLAAVTYDALDATNTTDLQAVLTFVRSHADDLGINPDAVAIWACSRNVSVALPVLAEPGADYIRSGVLYYGVTNPDIALRSDIPYFIARAGLDAPFINDGLDAQLARLVERNVAVEFHNHADGPHAFDIRHDSQASRQIIEATIDFLRRSLSVE